MVEEQKLTEVALKQEMQQEVEDNKPTESNMLEQARLIAERIERGNVEYKAILDRAEKLRVREILGGRAEAGQEIREKTVDEKDQEEANKFLNALK